MMVKPLDVVVLCLIVTIGAETNNTTEETTEAQESTSDDELRSIILKFETLSSQLAVNLSQLEREQRQQLDDIDARFSNIELRLSELEETSNRAHPTPELDPFEGIPDSLHEPLNKLHRKHEDQVERVQLHHIELNNTINNLHRQIAHITDLHDMPRRLQKIADLIVQKRWYEVMLNWGFVENNLPHEGNTHHHQLLAEHLRAIISHVCAGTGSDRERRERLDDLFKFVHRIDKREIQSFAYDTLVDEILTDSEIFNGSEIFALAYFLRQQVTVTNRAIRTIPRLAYVAASGETMKLALISKTKSTSRRMDQRVPEPLRNDSSLNFFELHVRADVFRKKKDKYLSFRYPVNASLVEAYTPESSGTWTLVYNEGGTFKIKNTLNEGFLNVPGEGEFLNTRGGDDRNKEFNLFLLDDYTVGIESANLKKPVIAVECEGGSTCFIVRGGRGHSRHNWTGSKFTMFPLVEPFDRSKHFFF